ncbi:MAG: hypothetical protein K2X81_10475, partial [Candidatus Obscuribacterales bacterium]|nr:hypothetical protein [Candidatus Obscuribacterales bacterium]
FTYVHEEKYQKLIYTITHGETATLVPDQKAHMAWISGNLYKVPFGSDNVIELASRPVISIGERVTKLDFNDTLSTVEVVPSALTDDNKAVVVSILRYYRHNESFQVKEYYGKSSEVARYNDTYKVWTVIIDGRIYAVAFDGDTVNDSSVTVVKAPSGLHRPDVLVIKTPGNDDPPVVVPGKGPKHPAPSDDNDPPVVVPSRR